MLHPVYGGLVIVGLIGALVLGQYESVVAQGVGDIAASSPLTTEADKNILFGGCESDPFPYLEQRHKGDKSNSFVTPTADKAKGLDTALACRLKKLLEFAESKGCPLTINSAMRPTQRCNPTGGACAKQGNSCHQYGRAVDLGGSARCLEWITTVIGRKNANSPFKLHVAYQENGNYRHIQCTEHIIANAGNANGCRSACDGGTSINPNVSNVAGPGSSSPSSGLTNQLREALGISNPAQQQPPQQLPQQQPSLPTQPSSQPTQYFPSSSSGSGSSGGSQIPTTGGTSGTGSSETGGGSTNGGTYSNTEIPFNDYTEPQSSSITQQLLEIAYGTSSTATSAPGVTFVPIGFNTQDVAGISGNQQSGTTSQNVTTPGSVTSLNPTQTFTSPDLSFSGSSQGAQQGQNTLQVLADLRAALVGVLEVLRPLGISTALRGDDTHMHE